jgi:hypothetical protein
MTTATHASPMTTDWPDALEQRPSTPIALDDTERTPCERWTRVMGYHRPISAFNAGKQAEHRDRVYFSATKAAADHQA